MSRKRDPRARLYLHREDLDELHRATRMVERALESFGRSEEAWRAPTDARLLRGRVERAERVARLRAIRAKLERARAKVPTPG